MLRLQDRWVWDLWLAERDDEYHLFYLQAPKALGDEKLRHAHATIGHAVSRDLISWSVLPDALGPGSAGAWDDLATWTGSVIADRGTWYMLYTGVSRAESGLVQRVGLATSPDLLTWTKHPANPVISADPRWYELLDHAAWREQAWRDPWVLRDESGDGFHALITARAARGPADGRGVIGHAWSADLISWDVRPPLTDAGDFGHLEVPQVERIGDGFTLVFSIAADDVSERRHRRQPSPTGTYVCVGESLLGPFDMAGAHPVGAPYLYSGRLVCRRDGSWALLGAVNRDASGAFVGEIANPIPCTELVTPGPDFDGTQLG
jgi:beta-fructofuranosidase